ncbi:MAG: thiamine pyrophosphate-binding protein, partial [Betaproteobacteria bacterium]|nr:thiamine pyrophosphate-binding protein [Betaproteobacteria bacterium]
CLSQGLRSLNTAYQGRDDSRKGECYEYRDTDFARIAQSFDCFGVTVEKPQDLRKAFEAAMASALPAVIDVKTEFAAQITMPWMPS